ncbi:MAG: hypothetical protein JNN20_13710 [Betaproteobacteria bacterium]|nr:hypothetical protein [Betaproteobacteria bacterium]
MRFISFQQVHRLLCAAAAVLMIVPALADPPARVGRVTLMEGNTQFFADREDGWQPAQMNYPVSSENSIWTDGPGRAEVRIGASAIRIDDDSVLDFVVIDEERIEAFLQRGTASIRLRQYGNIGIADITRIETSAGVFSLDAGGRYRIDAAADGNETRISVFSGRARFENGDTRLTIDAGKVLTVRSQGTATDFRLDNANESSLDRWASSRDAQWDATHTRYTRESVISPYMTGYEDLDQNGEWIDDQEYGRVWAPRVVVSGWAPYRYGRWSYVRPWGWTWIDDAPWGFAPFHYGRWVQVRSRWCWWPGTYQARPVYAPALVAWIGTPGGGLTISSGPSVGWFPLAPREYYVPRYNYSAGYGRRINYITNNNITVINPPANYRNHVPGATVVPNATFMNGNPVGGNRVQLSPRDIAAHRPITHFDATPRPRRAQPNDMPDRVQGNAPRPRFPSQGFAPGANNVPSPAAPSYSGPVPPVQKNQRPEPARVGPLPVQKATPETVRGVVPTDAAPPAAPTQPQQQPQQPQRRRPSWPGNDSQPHTPVLPPVTVNPAPQPNVDREPRAVPPSRQSNRQPQSDAPRNLPPPGGIPVPQSAPRQASEQNNAAPKPAPERSNKPRAETHKEPRERDNDGPNRPKKD